MIGITLGFYFRSRVPNHHLASDSKDTIKLASGLIGTMVALVLGLLVGSAKNTFDAANNTLIHDGAKIIMLDRAMRHYGVDTEALRSALRQNLSAGVEHLWPSGNEPSAFTKASFAKGVDKLTESIRSLHAQTEEQQQLKAQMLELSLDLQESSWLLLEESQGHLSPVFIMVLIFWMSILFMAFSLITPTNPTALAALLVAAICTAGAVFLTIEMSSPLKGFIRIEKAPLVNALQIINQPENTE